VGRQGRRRNGLGRGRLAERLLGVPVEYVSTRVIGKERVRWTYELVRHYSGRGDGKVLLLQGWNGLCSATDEVARLRRDTLGVTVYGERM